MRSLTKQEKADLEEIGVDLALIKEAIDDFNNGHLNYYTTVVIIKSLANPMEDLTAEELDRIVKVFEWGDENEI